MTRLLRAEFRRYYARRLARLGLLGALVVVLLFSWSNWSSTNPPSASELAGQQVMFEQALDDWEAYGAAELEKCKAAVADPTLEPDDRFRGMTAADCELMRPLREHFGWSPPKLADALAGVPLALSFSLGMITVVLAASYVGAEFTTGSIGNWLTFEPRRGRVFASKMIVVAAAAGALALVGTGLMGGLAWVIVKINKGDMTMPSGLTTHIVHTYWRGIVVIMAMAMITAGLAFLTRHTAAVVGIIIGWLMIVEGTVFGTLDRLRAYSLITNIEAWISGQVTYSTTTNCTSALGCQMIEQPLTWVHGGVEWGLLTAGITGLAWLIFARQDVT